MAVNLNTPEKTVRDPRLLELRGDLLVAECTEPLPPGSRVDLHFTTPPSQPPLAISGKIVSISRLPGGGFKISVRTSSVTKEATAALKSLL